MLRADDLPASQLYILFSAIATACAIVSAATKTDQKVSFARICVIFLLVAATLVAATPVIAPVAFDAGFTTHELSHKTALHLHLSSLAMLCLLAVGTFLMKGLHGGTRKQANRPLYYWLRRRKIRRMKQRLKRFR